MSYKSPIEVYVTQMAIEQNRKVENAVFEAIQGLDIVIAKDELIKALKYDRDQYEKGYADGYNTPGWTSVEDSLPHEDVRVLVYVDANHLSRTEMDTDRILDGKWVRWGTLVTHWKPLPKKPNEGCDK